MTLLPGRSAPIPFGGGLENGGTGGGATAATPTPDTIALGVNATGAPRVLRRTAAGAYVIDTPPAGIFPPAARDFESTPARSVNALGATLAFVDIRRIDGALVDVVGFGTDTPFTPAVGHVRYEPWEPAAGVDQETVVARSVDTAGATLGWVEIQRTDGEVAQIVDFGTDTVHVEDADHDHYEPWPPADAATVPSDTRHVILEHGDTWSPAADVTAGAILRSVQIDVLLGAASVTDSAGNPVAYDSMGLTISDPAGVDIGSIDADELAVGAGARVLVIWQEAVLP